MWHFNKFDEKSGSKNKNQKITEQLAGAR